MKVYGDTDIGMVRSNNQDAYKNTVLDANTVLSIICDGMGGAKAGNVASNMAVEIITDYVVKSYNPQMSVTSIENLMKNAILSANLEIYKAACNDEAYKGMGTTVVAALVKDNTAFISHVGDSRAYVISKDGIRQITRDHSVIQDLIEGGHITPDEAKNHPEKNIITRAVGTRENVITDFLEENIGDGVLLLCTDGITNTLAEETIETLVRENEYELVPQKIIEEANANFSNDNVTVTLVSQ